MHIKTALWIADDLGKKAKERKLSHIEWALRVLVGAYRRQKIIIKRRMLEK